MSRNVKIMGIINITSDSFYSGSRAVSEKEITERLDMLVSEGADIIDFGACSTRPGSRPVSAEDEWTALSRALRIFKALHPKVQFSVDTFRADVMKKCYDQAGPFIVNDISAGEDDADMLREVGRLGLEYIAMHKRGTPDTMQSMCDYDDVTSDVISYFHDFAKKAEDNGIRNWIVDPGFGFAKTIGQNYEMLDNLERFKVLGRPLLVGISRKSFIYKPLGTGPEDPKTLQKNTELHKIAIMKGADILRVHDVAAAKAIIDNKN